VSGCFYLTIASICCVVLIHKRQYFLAVYGGLAMKMTGTLRVDKNLLQIESLKDGKSVWLNINDLPEEQQLQVVNSNKTLFDYIRKPSDAGGTACELSAGWR
jgi:hypothetical protein